MRSVVRWVAIQIPCLKVALLAEPKYLTEIRNNKAKINSEINISKTRA